jgi:hypothetical protein
LLIAREKGIKLKILYATSHLGAKNLYSLHACRNLLPKQLWLYDLPRAREFHSKRLKRSPSASACLESGLGAYLEHRHRSPTREDLFAGALSSSLGLIPTWIFPPLVSEGDIQFSRCDQLSEAEARLNQDAMYDDKMTGPLAHVSNIIVNLAISAALGVGYGHWSSAWISSAAGIPVGELMILSYPRAASRLRNHYRSEEPDLAQDHSMLDHGHLAWVPGPDAQALVLSLNF